MYRRMALTIALAVSVLSMSLVSSDSTARAQKPNKFSADTGVITLGPNQMLRITIVNRGKADSNVSFRKTEYSQGACNGGVCKMVVSNEEQYLIGLLVPGEAVSIDIPNSSYGVRGTGFVAQMEFEMLTQVIDTVSGAIVSYSYSWGASQT